MLLDREDCFLLVVDVQQRLASAVLERDRVVANAVLLVESAKRLKVPVFMSEHCAETIGPLLPELRGLVPDDAILPKVHFAAAREPACAAGLSDCDAPSA